MIIALLPVLDPLVGVVLAGCGIVLFLRKRATSVGLLMLITAGCWFLGSAWGLLVFVHRGPLVQLHLTYPTGRTRRATTILVIIASYLIAIAEGVRDLPLLTLGQALLVAVAAVEIYARTSGPARKAGGPALAAALVFASVLVLSAVNQLMSWGIDRVVLISYDLAICAVALGLTADQLWGRWSAATVADFVSQLAVQSEPASLSSSVRKAMGDPSASIGFWVPDEGGYVDDGGQPLTVPAGDPARTALMITDAGHPVGVLVCNRALPQNPEVLADIGSALRLALASVQLRARVRANLAELTASRRRVVEVADRQRAELEAELAAGPQSDLAAALQLATELERQAGPAAAPGVRALTVAIRRAQGELIDIVRGVRPPELEAGGLAAALPLLAGRLRPVPVELRVCRTRFPDVVEGALYFVCAEALANVSKHAEADLVRVEVRDDAKQVTMIVSDDGAGGADPQAPGLRGLADRLAALGGRLSVTDAVPRGTVVLVTIPAQAVVA